MRKKKRQEPVNEIIVGEVTLEQKLWSTLVMPVPLNGKLEDVYSWIKDFDNITRANI